MNQIIRYPDNYGHDYNPKGLWQPFLQQVAKDIEPLKYPLREQTNTLDSYIYLLYGPANAIQENLLKAHLLPKTQATQLLYNMNNAIDWVPTIFSYQNPLTKTSTGFPQEWIEDYDRAQKPLAEFLHTQKYFGNSQQKGATLGKSFSTRPYLQTGSQIPIADTLANHIILLTNGIHYPLDNVPNNLYNSYWKYDFPKWATFKKTYNQYLQALDKAEKKTAKKNSQK